MIVILAEKPSVAKDIAAVVGARRRCDGYFEGDDGTDQYRVTWALGHLVGIPEPRDIDPQWAEWRRDTLPMLPTEFPLIVLPEGRQQFAVIRKLFRAKETREIICATDAGREGELIGRYIVEATGAQAPVRRLWVSSLTPNAIREALRSAKPWSHYDSLAAAARARAYADWLVGMNLSRAMSLSMRASLSIGRVQTPTLALIVARDTGIAMHVPESYRQVQITVSTPSGSAFKATYTRKVEDKTGKPKDSSRLPPPGTSLGAAEDANAIAARARTGALRVASLDSKQQSTEPPRFFDLTELQRTANSRFGWSAAHTLEVAQELYERHKLLSYPRTDSDVLSTEVAMTLPVVVSAVSAKYKDIIAPETGTVPLGKRYVDDSKVTDHHAIIPTGNPDSGLDRQCDAGQLYDLVVRRLLQAWQPPLVESLTAVEVHAMTGSVVDRYTARGKAVLQTGWKLLEGPVKDPESESDTPRLPPDLAQGLSLDLVSLDIVEDKTKPQPHFTEAALLRAMETAGQALAPELASAMRERGLGTPATRAAMIEKLVARGYIERKGRSLRATPAGMQLIRVVSPEVRSPALTGDWEASLRRIERGEDDPLVFLQRIRDFVAEHVREALAKEPPGDGFARSAATTRRKPAKGSRRPRSSPKRSAAQS